MAAVMPRTFSGASCSVAGCRLVGKCHRREAPAGDEPRGGGPATKEDETVARLGRWVLSNWASAWSIQRFDISEPNRSDRSCPHDLHPTVQMTPDPDGK